MDLDLPLFLSSNDDKAKMMSFNKERSRLTPSAVAPDHLQQQKDDDIDFHSFASSLSDLEILSDNNSVIGTRVLENTTNSIKYKKVSVLVVCKRLCHYFLQPLMSNS